MSDVKNGTHDGVNISREERARRNVERLHRMVLKKDNNVNVEYVENYYSDIAEEVSGHCDKG